MYCVIIFAKQCCIKYFYDNVVLLNGQTPSAGYAQR